MKVRPGRTFARPNARGPGKDGRAVGNVLALHEAMVVCMLRRGEYTMSVRDLVELNREYGLYRRPSDGEFPDYLQVRARIKPYRHLFELEPEPHDLAVVRLRQLGEAPALAPEPGPEAIWESLEDDDL